MYLCKLGRLVLRMRLLGISKLPSSFSCSVPLYRLQGKRLVFFVIKNYYNSIVRRSWFDCFKRPNIKNKFYQSVNKGFHSFIHSFIHHSFIYLFIHSFIHSLTWHLKILLWQQYGSIWWRWLTTVMLLSTYTAGCTDAMNQHRNALWWINKIYQINASCSSDGQGRLPTIIDFMGMRYGFRVELILRRVCIFLFSLKKGMWYVFPK